MTTSGPEFMTTKEVAALLRLKERRVYDLAASGDIPCTRALGKLLFQRSKIDAWLAGHSVEAASVQPPAPVLLGSHDPLLDWAIRESQSGIATFFDGSFDGLGRFGRAEGIATGMHVRRGDDWNVPLVAERFAGANVVLVEWSWRERGLIVAPGNPKTIARFGDLASLRVAPRQETSGSQALFLELAKEAGLDGKIDFIRPARTETDAAVAVAEGAADAAIGLLSVARQYRLDFVPLLMERFDLLVDRSAWFDQPFQRFLSFIGSPAFAERAQGLVGYDMSGTGRVHFNAAPPAWPR